MLALAQVGAPALAGVLLIAVPGPGVMFVAGRALSQGRGNALASVAGNALGCYLVGLVGTLGLGPLLERSELLFQAIKRAGILHLLHLGLQAMRHAAPVRRDAPARLRAGSPCAAPRTGVAVGLANPKSLILFTAVVPQSIVPVAGSIVLQIAALGLIPLPIGLVADTARVLSAARIVPWPHWGISIVGTGSRLPFRKAIAGSPAGKAACWPSAIPVAPQFMAGPKPDALLPGR
ncbi:LysE family translocator [Paeniglutamicibacter psychrophenolicus]|uniref:LysE family translocator n=1 Tax=Paeniglutamicibacter psychrophenolicus TaxID=257454 RepID=UPI0027801FB7|nr:LysE family translocator [Paeniglutamicibacter psychrophenolicus]MDQ0095647.1 threonine/homoserine/homoserine lactone efflux protein [Paeniglutamicibacter psychrophenolicus]